MMKATQDGDGIGTIIGGVLGWVSCVHWFHSDWTHLLTCSCNVIGLSFSFEYSWHAWTLVLFLYTLIIMGVDMDRL